MRGSVSFEVYVERSFRNTQSRRRKRGNGAKVVKLPLAILLGLLTLAALYASRLFNYLLFHTLAEVFAIVIGCGIFVIAWNTRRFLNNSYLMLLGVAYLFVAVLSLAHTLAYRGMPIFPNSDANLATQLWIATRFLESISLVVAPLLLHRRARAALLLLVYGVVCALLLLSIFWWRIFPVCFIEGEGLTTFKVVSEYVIMGIFVTAIILLLRERRAFDQQVLRWLVMSLVITICSEAAFTLYVDVYDLYNLVGHFLKIIAMYLVYKAIIETGLGKPFSLLLRNEKLTEEKLQQLVRERTAKLEATTEQLNSVVYTMAHDLRAPLRTQHGFARLLLEDYGASLGPEGKSWLRKIADAAVRMDMLVSDLLEYSTVSAGNPVITPVPLASVAQQARAAVEQKATTPGTTIDTAAVAGDVLAETEFLLLAVQNLISNAVKFTRPGEAPRVRLWVEPRDGWLRLWVEDKGIGIAPEYHHQIFGVFQRLHRTSEYPGTGIGLALVKKSVERLGGRVGLESEPGKGSRFWLELKKA